MLLDLTFGIPCTNDGIFSFARDFSSLFLYAFTFSGINHLLYTVAKWATAYVIVVAKWAVNGTEEEDHRLTSMPPLEA